MDARSRMPSGVWRPRQEVRHWLDSLQKWGKTDFHFDWSRQPDVLASIRDEALRLKRCFVGSVRLVAPEVSGMAVQRDRSRRNESS
jgi:hypothetical protein